jgi:hypothetical protein
MKLVRYTLRLLDAPWLNRMMSVQCWRRPHEIERGAGGQIAEAIGVGGVKALADVA